MRPQANSVADVVRIADRFVAADQGLRRTTPGYNCIQPPAFTISLKLILVSGRYRAQSRNVKWRAPKASPRGCRSEREMPMRAQIIEGFGETDVFQLASLPESEHAPGELVVALAATSVNPVDDKIRRYAPSIAPVLPTVLGCDVAGTVVALGAGVSDFKVGDEVYGCAGASAATGSAGLSASR
jgi:hypothetical protein